MADHYVTKCSCGRVLSQCRCSAPDKTVVIQQDGCQECQARIQAKAKKPMKSEVVKPDPEAYKNTNLGVPTKDQPKALEFSKRII